MEKYIISLKPYYDYDELKDIFEQSKPKEEESITTKTLKNTYTI